MNRSSSAVRDELRPGAKHRPPRTRQARCPPVDVEERAALERIETKNSRRSSVNVPPGSGPPRVTVLPVVVFAARRGSGCRRNRVHLGSYTVLTGSRMLARVTARAVRDMRVARV